MTLKRLVLLTLLLMLLPTLTACGDDGFAGKDALETAVANLGGNPNFTIISTVQASGNLGNLGEAWCVVISPTATDIGELRHIAMSRLEGEGWQIRATDASPDDYIVVVFTMWHCENYGMTKAP